MKPGLPKARRPTSKSPCRHQRCRVILSTVLFVGGLWAYLAVVEIQDPRHPVQAGAGMGKRYFSPPPLERYQSTAAAMGELELPGSL